MQRFNFRVGLLINELIKVTQQISVVVTTYALYKYVEFLQILRITVCRIIKRSLLR